jgi:diacylglycerol kinase family enzyme
MKVVAIVNSRAGTVAGGESESFRASLAEAFQQHGIEAELQLVEGGHIRESAELALAAALEGRIDAVVVGGGDGTIRTVAGVLAGTGVPLGILPLGTLNHFAKDLAIPPQLEAATAVIGDGYTRRIDLGEVNDEVFVNNSSLGIYPYLVADRERQTSETSRPKWIAASLAFLRVLRRFPTRRLTVRFGSGAEPIRTPCLFIGNNEYELSPLAIGKRMKLDGGELWLCVANQRDPARFLWLAFRLIVGVADPAKELVTAQVTAVEITSRSSRLPVALDGEVVTMRPPLLYRSRPGDLVVFAPRPTSP